MDFARKIYLKKNIYLERRRRKTLNLFINFEEATKIIYDEYC